VSSAAGVRPPECERSKSCTADRDPCFHPHRSFLGKKALPGQIEPKGEGYGREQRAGGYGGNGKLGISAAALLARVEAELQKVPKQYGGSGQVYVSPRLNGVFVTADPVTGRATSIERLSISGAELDLLAEQQSAATS